MKLNANNESNHMRDDPKTAQALSPEDHAAVEIYRALVCIADGDVSSFWSFLPTEQRTEAHTILDDVIEKLVALSVEEKLGAIVRAGRRS
jgi:hypothetical protein